MTMRETAVRLCVALLFASSSASADAVTQWNEILISMVEQQPPPLQNRYAAITHLAIFEAVNSITGEYEPYLGTVSATYRASTEAAAIGAAYRVLRTYFPDRAADLDSARATSLARIPDGQAKRTGIAVGEQAAAAITTERVNDGSELAESHIPASTNPGEWQLTPDCPAAGGVFLHWRRVQPFAIRRADRFRSDPPPRLTGSGYARAYKEVLEIGGRDSAQRPLDRTNVATLYAIVGDAVLWNPIARQIAAKHARSLTHTARAFALLNMALSDGGVAVLDTKYHYNFWRPETAIAGAATDGNDRTEPAAEYVPFITAPCFPSYPSGHATTSYAARKVLERIYGERGHAITVSSAALPDVVLKYSTLKAITSDIDDARVYGGIHFRFDQEAGAEQGLRIGAYVFEHSLRPVPECRCARDQSSHMRADRADRSPGRTP